MLGDLTHVVRNAIARLISSLALLVTYKAFATMVWKAAAASSDSFSQCVCVSASGYGVGNCNARNVNR